MQLIWNHLKPVSWLLAPVVGGDFVQVHVLPFLFFVPEAKDDLVAAKVAAAATAAAGAAGAASAAAAFH